MPRRKKEVETITHNKPWMWVHPEYRDDNYDGVIMESAERLIEADKIRRKNKRNEKT
jgi:hypothetical protein